MRAHPIRLAVSDDLKRSRLTVLLRGFLAIPHLLWLVVFHLAVFGLVYTGLVLFAWATALIWGRVDDDVHSILARYLRYLTHVYAYLTLVGGPYPPFRGQPGTYTVDLVVEAPERQSRWVTFFRLILAVPALVLAGAFASVLVVLALAGWFVALALGRVPHGMRELGAYCLRYSAQTLAYLFLLTPRYPTLATPSAPRLPPESELRP